MILIDCNNLGRPNRVHTYGGMTGAKHTVYYNSKVWMLKSQERLRDKHLRNVEISYANDPVTEYIGSHIYGLLNMPVHETLLGSYKNRICVLCQDTVFPERVITIRDLITTIDQDSLKQTPSGMSHKIADVFEILTKAPQVPFTTARERFWQMFVVDAWIGNTDRNNGNWGFYYNEAGQFVLYPVYDCGGCLNNKRSTGQMEKSLASESTMEMLALNFTTVFLDARNKRINPLHTIKNTISVPVIHDMVKRIVDLDFTKVQTLLQNMLPVINQTQVSYYETILRLRLDYFANLLH